MCVSTARPMRTPRTRGVEDIGFVILGILDLGGLPTTPTPFGDRPICGIRQGDAGSVTAVPGHEGIG